MSKVSQRQAVFAAVCNVMGEHGVHFREGMIVKDVITKDMRAEVNAALCKGFRDGSIELGTAYETDAELKEYTSGLISNWLRKDPNMNGGTKYVPANPGSRVSDPQLKALKALLAQTTEDSDKAEIEGFIATRIAELGASKAKVKPIDYSALPAELRERFGK